MHCSTFQVYVRAGAESRQSPGTRTQTSSSTRGAGPKNLNHHLCFPGYVLAGSWIRSSGAVIPTFKILDTDVSSNSLAIMSNAHPSPTFKHEHVLQWKSVDYNQNIIGTTPNSAIICILPFFSLYTPHMHRTGGIFFKLLQSKLPVQWLFTPNL